MERTYTIGELARLAGVSVKTLRVYERKGLLFPQRNIQNGYRVYTEAAVRELEKIQLMKYLDFSLEQIEEFLKRYEAVGREEMLLTQKRLLEQKRAQLDSVISCVEKAATECKESETDADTFLKALGNIVKNQRADELADLYGRYSDEPRGWSRFVFTQAGLCPGMRILDAGAGYGNLWRYNLERIPDGVRITCVDRHNTHADGFFKYVKEKEGAGELPEGQFSFLWGDLEQMEICEKFHCIFLNHVAFFIQEKECLYERLRNRLSENGVLVCTWGGGLLFENIRLLFKEFSGNSAPVERRYTKVASKLEKAEEELLRIFPGAERRSYILELRFDTAEEFMEYIFQACRPAEAAVGQRRDEFLQFLRSKRCGQGSYGITKDTYLYLCRREAGQCLPE